MTTATYYVEGIHYSDLSDLLSDGWAEDKAVQIYTGPNTTLQTSTIAALREQFRDPAVYAKQKRVVAVANEGFVERVPAPGTGYRYAVALIKEDEPGWILWNWHGSLDAAKGAADAFNRVAGHTQGTVLDVQVSSMRAGRVR